MNGESSDLEKLPFNSLIKVPQNVIFYQNIHTNKIPSLKKHANYSSVKILGLLRSKLNPAELSAARHTKSELKIFQNVKIKELIVCRKVSIKIDVYWNNINNSIALI